MGKDRPLRYDITKEMNFYDSCYSGGGQMEVSRFERWIRLVSPKMMQPDEYNKKLLKALGDVKNKCICEFGCGNGKLTQALVNEGAYVSAIDVSMEAVRTTRENFEDFNPMQLSVQQMDICNLNYNSESFDLVVGVRILHHIDIDKAVIEISRVLKLGGRGIFIEPLSHNPLSNMWRRLTPSIRTPTEWPLSYSDIDEMGRHFSIVNYKEFGLLPLLSSLVFLFTFSQKAKRASAKLLFKLESPFLRLCKPLRKYSGEILIEFTK